MGRATTRPAPSGTPSHLELVGYAATVRQHQARDAHLEQSRQDFETMMAESREELLAALRTEAETVPDVEDADTMFAPVDMSDLPPAEFYGETAWGREYERRSRQAISDGLYEAVAGDYTTTPGWGGGEPDVAMPEAWGPDLIQQALRAEAGR